jgi:hypothetical protein
MNFKRQHLHRDEIGHWGQLRKALMKQMWRKMTWQNRLLFHHAKVCMSKVDHFVQSDRGVHYNTSVISDDEFISVPLAPQRVSKGRQLMGWTNSSIYLFTGDMTGKGQNIAPHINSLNSIQCFHVVFCSCHHFVDGGTNWYYQQYLD